MLGIDSVLSSARRIAEMRMRDLCVAYRTTGDREKCLYRGKCRVRTPAASASIMLEAGAPVSLQQTTLSLPFGVSLKRGDKVKIVRAENRVLKDRVFTVRAVPVAAQNTANRYNVELMQ